MERWWRHPMILSGGTLLGLFLAIALLSTVYTPHDPWAVDLSARHLPPGTRTTQEQPPYWLGTDAVGRDILSRAMVGAQISLRVGVLVVAMAMTVGTAIGTVAAYFGGRLDAVLMRLMDILLALPGILLAIVVVSVLGPSLRNAMVAVSVVSIPTYARVMRAEVLRVKEQPYVLAARALGAGHWRILRHTILPNSLAPLMVQATLGMGTAILETAGLSYLGLGDDPSTPEWGRMIADQFRYIRTAWWTVLPPLVAISAVVLGFNLLGDGLRDVLDPRLKRER